MAEMDARFQQILQLRLRHALPFVGSIRRRRHLRCNPAGGTQHRIGRREYFNRCTMLRRYVLRTIYRRTVVPSYRRTVVRLSLTELEPLARPRPTRLLALDDPRIARQQDRKSTRLNSSHLVISYAVFCLKKKKQMNTLTKHCI